MNKRPLTYHIELELKKLNIDEDYLTNYLENNKLIINIIPNIDNKLFVYGRNNTGFIFRLLCNTYKEAYEQIVLNSIKYVRTNKRRS